jgi:hypothetical protein
MNVFDLLRSGKFKSRYINDLNKNFENAPEYMEKRRFLTMFANDPYKKKHFLPLFLSKISSPDSSNLKPDPETNKPTRGIRTLAEIAHYVRCIPVIPEERPNIWANPDFFLTMKKGTSEDHALLMVIKL